MNMIRVMIADDHSLMRKGLQQILELRRHQGYCTSWMDKRRWS